MSDQREPILAMRQISDLEVRIGELRLAATLPDADLRGTLDAALAELGLALSALRLLEGSQNSAEGLRVDAEAERRMLRTVFQDVPVPLFLLDGDAVVRRVNRQAAVLLSTSAGYVAGKPFPVFCDLQSRSTLRSQLAGVVRTGRRRHVDVTFLSAKSPVNAVMALARVWIRGEPDPMVIAAAIPKSGRLPAPEPLEETQVADDSMVTTVHRMDLLASATELFLSGPSLNESVAVRRCARLLATELADWVIIDLEQDGALARQVVFGPDEESGPGTARVVEDLDPVPGTLPSTVYDSGQMALHAHVEDLNILGVTADGLPVCGLVGATSVLSVPIDDGERCLGVITLMSGGQQGQFDLLDLGVMQRLARHLALVIKAARKYQRRSEVAEALQSSLLPRALPSVPGLEVAARYFGATRDVKVGGDFYDVFRTGKGWALVLGDVSGKGEAAAAVTATARHGIRLLSRWKSDSAEVLTLVNEALLDEDRFVTAVLAFLEPQGPGMAATIGCAGHPPAVVVRADGVIRTANGGGVPLGLFEEFEPATETIDLGEGDILLLYSDGVLDACDVMRERFGPERLIEILAGNSDLPVGEILMEVERALIDFCAGDLTDDVSILAVRVLPETLSRPR